MTTLSLDNEIKHYLPLLNLKQKQSLLTQIKTLLENKNVESSAIDFLAQYNRELQEAEKRVKAGNFTTLEDLKIESENW